MAPPKIYGLIGYPVKHSLSPGMHNAAFSALKINAEYRLFEKRPEELDNFFSSLAKEDIHGLNVTIPYKEKVIALISKISEEARLIGAVNTIKVYENKLEGFNTDGAGFLEHLTKDLGFAPGGKNISIIGAGGAARAISVYLAKEKPKSISIYDTDKVKAETLANHLKESFDNLQAGCAASIEELNIRMSDLLVNASPVGMKQADPCLVSEKLIHKNLLVYDLIYNPCQTKLLRIAKEKGAKASCGLGMLLYQGARSFQIWTGRDAPIDIMRQALNKEANKL